MKKGTLWYMFQPIMCFLGLHDWYQGARGGRRECEYCGRVEVFDHFDAHGRVHWRKK